MKGDLSLDVGSAQRGAKQGMWAPRPWAPVQRPTYLEVG